VGVPVIANGVVTEAERRLLESLGVTGFSGPALLATEAQVPQPA
jgi:EAL domain-containing protein (putative c-di-GMP-specific phosphodiesterase class I)